MIDSTLELIELPIDELIHAPSLDGIEVFLKLSDPSLLPMNPEHYVKIAYRIEDLDAERVRELKYRGIEFVHLNLENLDRYLTFEQKVLRAATQAPLLNPKKKFSLVRTTLNHLIRRMHTAEVSAADLTYAIEATSNTIQLLDSLPRGEDLITLLDKVPNDLYNHIALTTIFSLLIAKELKWTTPAILQKIALTALFHDHALKSLSNETRLKNIDVLSIHEQTLLHGHPERSASAIESMDRVGHEVALAIRQHHERMDGSGFPRGLKGRKIQPMAMIIAVADEFIDSYYNSKRSQKVSLETFMKNFKVRNKKTLPEPALAALCRVLKINLNATQTNGSVTRGGLNIG